MSERSLTDGAGAHWFEILVDPPNGFVPIWTVSTWLLCRSVNGLVQTMETTAIWEGGATGQYRMLPGKKSWPNLVLQGVIAIGETAFFAWFDSVKIGKIGKARANGLIALRTGDHPGPIATWTFTGAFPVKYTGPTLDTHSSLLAFETIELTHQGLERRS
jgi:phage tail-like protein